VSVGGVSLNAMELFASQAFASRLEYLPEIGSTNTYLLEKANDLTWPDFSVVLTDNQTAGRGRLDRSWQAQPGKALAISVLLRPVGINLSAYGWLPLLAGVAMKNAVASLIAEAEVGLKWPNDVLVSEEKIAGVLSELASNNAVVVGAGLNLLQTKAELPIPNATSLALHSVTGFQLDDIAVRYLASFKRLYENFSDAQGDAVNSGLMTDVIESSLTIGKKVLVVLPDETEFEGIASGLDESGRLLVSLTNPTEIRAVAAADIKHLRQ
jgi:BirA family transcriptional regulator, biotin operon repressor / biotin---[acetyl-CoA-carboxylase] ligase